MRVIDTELADVKIIEPQVFGDERGFFMETYQKKKMAELGITQEFVQDNHSKSQRGILRGLHFQKAHPQGKLVHAVFGEIFDVAVDLRKDSGTYGQWVGIRLSAENKRMLWVPEGFAHGFYVTSRCAEVIYKCTDFYVPKQECTIRWNDPTLAINWPLIKGNTPILSSKDEEGLAFEESGYFQDGIHIASGQGETR